MKYIYSLIILLLATSQSTAQQIDRSIDAEMTRLGVETMLLVPSQALDEHPLWSPNSDRVGVNVAGHWFDVSLSQITLEEAVFRNKKIGYAVIPTVPAGLSLENQSEFANVTNFGVREVIAKDGTIYSMQQSGFGTSFVIHKPDFEPIVQWTSDFENCHSLSLSPDGKFVAFLCEQNGLFLRFTN